jgi:RNA polymerase sigma-70 factor, ECF subfamily
MDELYLVPFARRMSISEERSWLPSARRGEPWALEQLYACYQPQVYALCHRLLGRADDAEDATQATFVQAFRALGKFRGDSTAKTWIYRIALNQALGILRKRARSDEPLDETLPAPESAGPSAERLAVTASLRGLKPDHQAVLVLRFWEELSYEEISGILGVPLPTVKMRLSRAKAEFRKQYGSEP